MHKLIINYIMFELKITINIWKINDYIYEKLLNNDNFLLIFYCKKSKCLCRFHKNINIL